MFSEPALDLWHVGMLVVAARVCVHTCKQVHYVGVIVQGYIRMYVYLCVYFSILCRL